MSVPISIIEKLGHAQSHLQTLDAELVRYYETEPAVRVIQRDGEHDVINFLDSAQVPPSIPLVLGDFLQTLRAVLDYLVWQLVLTNKKVPSKHNMFLIAQTEKDFRDWSKKRLLGVDPQAVDLISTYQPYTFGEGNESQSMLFALDELVNIDKHRYITLTDLAVTPIRPLEVRDSAGHVVGFDPAQAGDNGNSIAFIEQAVKYERHVQVAAYVRFKEGALRGFEPFSCAHMMYMMVRDDIIPQFEKFF